MQGFSAGRLLRRRLAATAVASASAVPLGRCLRPVQLRLLVGCSLLVRHSLYQ